MLLRQWTEWWSYHDSICDDRFDNDNNNTTDSGIEWYDHYSSKTTPNIIRPQRILLLDIRPYQEYQRRNLSSLVAAINAHCEERQQIIYVHIPFDEVWHRKFELPPRQIPFAILSSFPEDDWHCHWQSIQIMLSSSTTTLGPKRKKMKTKKGTVTASSNLVHNNNNNNNNSQDNPPTQLQPSWNVIALFNANDDKVWEAAAAAAQRPGDCPGDHPCPLVPQHNDNVPSEKDHHPISSPREQIPLPLARLWSPDPMIESILLPLLKEKLRSIEEQPKLMEVWDIGSGLGRDVCFIAEELLYHSHHNMTRSENNTTPKLQNESLFRIIGYDQRYRHMDATANTSDNSKNDHTDDTTEFWKRRHVTTVTECYCCDLNHFQMNVEALSFRSRRKCINGETGTTTTINTIKREPFSGCIYAVRYWNKAFFQTLIDAGCRNDNHDSGQTLVLEVGTIIAISHFGKASAQAQWDHPHPKAAHVLERNELRAMFTATTTATTTTTASNNCNSDMCQPPARQRSWKILHDKVVCDSDHGRTLIQFVAQLE